MEIILKKDIQGLGYQNDVVNVKPGYGRNYLIPRGMAIIASPSNRKRINEEVKQAAHKAEKIKKDAELLAQKIGDTMIEIPTKAGESGKIFGAITPLQISEALLKKGINVDRKYISLEEKIKMVGEYKAILNLHKQVLHTINIKVIKE